MKKRLLSALLVLCMLLSVLPLGVMADELPVADVQISYDSNVVLSSKDGSANVDVTLAFSEEYAGKYVDVIAWWNTDDAYNPGRQPISSDAEAVFQVPVTAQQSTIRITLWVHGVAEGADELAWHLGVEGDALVFSVPTTVTFVPGDAALEDSLEAITVYAPVAEEQTVVTGLPAPTSGTHHFLGWAAGENEPVKDSVTVATGTTTELTAAWEACSDLNGGFCSCGRCMHQADYYGYCTEKDCDHDSDCCTPAPAAPAAPTEAELETLLEGRVKLVCEKKHHDNRAYGLLDGGVDVREVYEVDGVFYCAVLIDEDPYLEAYNTKERGFHERTTKDILALTLVYKDGVWICDEEVVMALDCVRKLPAELTWTIVARSGKNGEISPEGKVFVTEGKDQTFVFRPDKGYRISAVYVDGERVKGKIRDEFTFCDVDENHTIYVEFAPVSEHPGYCPTDWYSDLYVEAWYHQAADFVIATGLMTGVDAYEFDPYGETSRAMLVTVLYRLEGEPAVSGTAKFKDVPAGQWYTNAVIWADQNGIVNGYNKTTFGAKDPVTREQMAAILYRYAKYKGYDVSELDSLRKYIDVEYVSDYALTPVRWSVGEQIIKGESDGYGNLLINPQSGTTRIETAAMVLRLAENVLCWHWRK